jgi:hypothetical protein
MSRFLGAVCLTFLVCALGSPARAEGDKDANAIIDKAVKALGGEEKLKAVKAATWNTKGTITFGGADNAITTKVTVEGLDHFRQEFEGEFMGNKLMGVTVLNGDKGWRDINGNKMALEGDDLANTKRMAYLQAAVLTILPLKGKGFKVKAGGEEKVNDKPALVLKVTGPDGKDFTLYFDKESGLPVRQVAKVLGFDGNEFTQETTFSNFKEVGGIKRPGKVVSKRDGEKFVDSEVTEFKVLDKVDAKTFAEPK